MPEADVVWRSARRLDEALAGRPLRVADLRWPGLSTLGLTGRVVHTVTSVGKHILTRLDPGNGGAALTVHSHLRMDGSWHVHRTGRPGDSGRDREIRAILGNAEWTAIGYLLGELDVVLTADEDRLVGHLGPDLLGPGWDQDEAVRRLAARPERPIGDALLDQTNLAGVGTFYMSEVLFLRGASPWTPAGEVRDLPRLVQLVHRVVVANAGRAVQSTTGDTRPERRQWVHARSGHPCRRCGTSIRVAPIGTAPRERIAFYCPACQAGPQKEPDGPAAP